MSSPAFRCADGARERADPLLGTAPTAAGLLLIEHPGPWRFDAVAGTGWSAGLIERLTAAIRRTRSRVLLIRRPGRRVASADRAASVDRAWAVVRVGGGTQWGRWQDERALDDALLALLDVDDLAVNPSTSAEPLLLVCAHGVHDTCCAVRGRPVAAALAQDWPEHTWECSHVGGDRFAANLVTLPDGTYYGGLDAGSARRVVTDHLAGKVDADHLRGSVRWPPVAQVAAGEIHRRRGPFGAADVRPIGLTDTGPGRWLVRVLVPSGVEYGVEVETGRRPVAMLTCAASQATAATGYRVTGVHEVT